MQDKRITLAWTGASGAPYGLRLLECLLAADYQVYLLISSAARVVLATEHGLKLPAGPEAAQAVLTEHLNYQGDKLTVCGKEDWFSPVASGSAAPKKMVVCPCSAGTLASVAHGLSDNLLERAADVVLKERGQLLMVVRETPFSSLHLENMLKLSNLGATIMPAAPGFYHQPKSIDDLVDFMVARILDHLGVGQGLVPRWGYDHRPS
ncbi:UbiX family flavin prenyltransferase [Photobacterium sp. WH77]|uniref:Flavin prenyltransferase UbiX n=1 Tax=Photobacterium arenosum TaxID=2774143 RepID=A0ABR9BJ92_9GAMM|nr:MULTISPECIES: flavin prenyltransferase UbiX [Photobacterium]MBD8512609.1 UbiX family flavin prenyltransferase [Photobacterium arenosum]MBV7261309.1 UbiX family flavin prenyltransferase [Photobacterium sp. WH24]MCG2835261.1 UbiX family flavin prenyltransferase [Photobacterium sp. WH77]MCG2842874.1 UbiX family flavin prenyltransferase [Photobacterium sp. WH80]MDO6583014.1 flavin prenyltransferase UbiX [Photobacterium sp. 2_MG-2023]